MQFELHDCIDGIVQDCSNSSALAMALLQSCSKSSICIVQNILTIDMPWLAGEGEVWGVFSEFHMFQTLLNSASLCWTVL